MSANRQRCGTCKHYTRQKPRPKEEYKNGTQYYGWCKRFEHIVHANENAPERRKCHQKKDLFKDFPKEACFGGVSPPEAVLIPQEEWEEARNKEDAGENHPCNSWNINECDCKGACSCHWR